MTQTVANNKTDTPSVEDNSALDELDTLLAQYDEGTEPVKTETKPSGEPPRDKRIDALLAREAESDLSAAVDTIMDDIEIQLPRSMIKGYLYSRESEDPRIGKAFDERFTNPAGWKKVLSGLAKEASNEFKGLPDKSLTNDRDVVEAAVRSASTSSNEAREVNFVGMNRNQLDRYLDDL